MKKREKARNNIQSMGNKKTHQQVMSFKLFLILSLNVYCKMVGDIGVEPMTLCL
jgi:hypothetical protein